MSRDLCEIVFILDNSGSMAGLEGDTIGSFNGVLNTWKKKGVPVLVSTVLFNHECRVLFDREPIAHIRAMTSRDYSVGGCTALYDAVGGAINHVRWVHRALRLEDVPGQTLFVIITDGEENSSREYSRKNIRSMIDEQKKQGWEFVFLGADIDAEAGCDDLSLDRRSAVNVQRSAAGVQASFAFLADEIPQFLASRSQDKTTDDGAAGEKVCWSAAFERWQDDTKRSR